MVDTSTIKRRLGRFIEWMPLFIGVCYGKSKVTIFTYVVLYVACWAVAKR